MSGGCIHRNACDYCGSELSGPWLLLNRYGIGTGKNRCLTEKVFYPDDGGPPESVWKMDTDGEDVAIGSLLCWPVCAVAWIEGKMVETDTEMRLRGEGET